MELSSNRYYVFMSLGISALTMLPQLIFSPSFKHSFFLAITFILLLSITKFSRAIFAIFVIFINITNIIIGHIAMHWSYSLADISPRIEAAVLSPAYETTEYLSTYIDYRDVLIVVYTIFVFYLLFKFIVHFSHSFRIMKVIGLSVFIGLMISLRLYYDPIKKMEPFSIPRKYIKIVEKSEYSDIIVQRKEYLRTLDYDVQLNTNAVYDKVVVVMGESANKHHMTVYGYDINTTPFLSSLLTKNYTYMFDAIAPTNQTRYSVPIELTKANVHDFFNLYSHSTSIVSDFHINGYKTYWVSNQGKLGKHDYLITALANEADIQMFANLSFDKAKTDHTILDSLEEVKNSDSKEMYVIHLIGSHSAYNQRYTKDISLYEEPKDIVEDYDNTIFYTDYILSQIYNRFKDKKLLLVYLSDHAEVVSHNKFGHGFLPSYKDEYDIPFIVYSSIKNTRLEELYKENNKRYLNAESLNYFVKYISGISDENNISYSQQVFSLDPKNVLDYDSLDFYK